MLILQVFAPSLGLISPSPFSMKAIALLQMSGLDYKIKAADVRKSPKKKLPVLIDGDLIIPDSTHIQAHLKAAHGFDPDKSLNAEQLATAEAFRRLIEEHLYWVAVYERWVEKPDMVREAFFAPVPILMRKFVFNMVQKDLRRSIYGQGIGRHSIEEIHAFGAADLKALANYLGDKDYFFGDTPTSVDATLFGMLSNIIVPPIQGAVKEQTFSHANLVAFHDRFQQRFDIPKG